MTEQKFYVNLKLYWIYIYEPRIQTSTQSAPVSVGKALVLNCYFYMIRQEMEIFLDQLWFNSNFGLENGDAISCNLMCWFDKAAKPA